MKRNGILNRELSAMIAQMGHGDMILIGDAGCAFPTHDMTKCLDLAVCHGVPLVRDVLKAVLDELEVESYIVADETKSVSPAAYQEFRRLLSGYRSKGSQLPEATLPHVEMKKLWLHGPANGQQMQVFVRTGECTAYGYIILVAGVSF